MVCAKCQRLSKGTTLATPGVKRKSEIYYGSPASGSGAGNASSSSNKNKTSSSSSSSAVLGKAGVSKSKLLGKNAKNPYASYSSSCRKCTAKTEQGKVLCHGCAYKENACAMCGKSEAREGWKKGVPVVMGQKFSSK
ncbi:MAG: hypothetical protein LQ340_003083 [Diploschistes diacapsis]|nr:MAG: hypothetical protein LQ340_003083 [Diploschistes diacapsis]